MMDYPLVELSQHQIEQVNKFNNNSKIKFERTSCLMNFDGIEKITPFLNCSSINQQILFTNDRYGLNQKTVLCKKCGLIFSNPRMTQDSTNFFYMSDLYRKLYSSGTDEQHSSGTDEQLEKYSEKKFDIMFSLEKKKELNLSNYYDQIFFDIVHSLNLNYHSVCEIGAGAGWNLKPFQLIGKDVLGYEPSEFLSNFSKTKKINVINGFIGDIKGEYDLVIMRHVLEHLLNPINEIMKLRKHIKKYFFIEVPGCINTIPSIQNAHNFYFSLNTLYYILTKCGFKKIYLNYCRSNEFIFALFEKSDKIKTCQYNYSYEVKRITRIYNKFCIRRVVRKTLKKIHPNLEKIILNIYKKLHFK